MPDSLIYDRLVLQDVLDKTPRPFTFLRDMFFRNTKEHTEEHFGFDIYKGSEQIAPFVHPEIGGVMLEKKGYETKIFTPPEVAPEKIITLKDLGHRLAGEEINARLDWVGRQRKLAAQFTRELDMSIVRREEIMCSQLLTTGQIPIVGEGYPSSVIRFWPLDPAEQPYIDVGIVNTDAYWDGTDAAIIDDLILGADRVEDNSEHTARVAILGSGAAHALRTNETFWKQLDNRRVNPGELVSRRLGGGARYLGTMIDSGLELYTYRGSYVHPVTKVRTPFIPTNGVLIGSPNADTMMNYGAVIYQDEASELQIPIARDRVIDSWMQRKRPAGRVLRMRSRPLPTVRDIDSFVFMKVLAG